MFIRKGFYTILINTNGVTIRNSHNYQTMTNKGCSGWKNISISNVYYLNERRLARFVRKCDNRGVNVPVILRKAVAANVGAVWDNKYMYWF